MKLRLTVTAARQLERILAYIDERSPQGARRVQARLLEIMNLLARHASIGTATACRPRRRLVAAPYPYAITYRIEDDAIVILGISHTAAPGLIMSGSKSPKWLRACGF